MNQPAAHQTCPYCHTPIAVERYEVAVADSVTYRVCPECDHTMLLPMTGSRSDETDALKWQGSGHATGAGAARCSTTA